MASTPPTDPDPRAADDDETAAVLEGEGGRSATAPAEGGDDSPGAMAGSPAD